MQRYVASLRAIIRFESKHCIGLSRIKSEIGELAPYRYLGDVQVANICGTVHQVQRLFVQGECIPEVECRLPDFLPGRVRFLEGFLEEQGKGV